MINGLEAVLRDAARALDSLGVQWCLVGGLAVAARAEPRFTRDIDLAVSVSGDDEAEDLIRGLAGGYIATTSVEHEATGRLASVRLQPSGENSKGIVVDLLFASSGIEPEIVAASEDLEILPDLRARVARVGHLIALKLLAADEDRPQDAFDVRALRAVAGPKDRDLASEAAALIEQRGFARGRDLSGLVAEALGG